MEEKLLKIINNYGVLHQLKYLQGEMYELNEAIIQKEYPFICSKHKNNDIDKFETQHIMEELADVFVMLCQIKEYYKLDGNDIMKIMKYKIDRQLSRMEKEGEINE